jgi:hypothetical protein
MVDARGDGIVWDAILQHTFLTALTATSRSVLCDLCYILHSNYHAI